MGSRLRTAGPRGPLDEAVRKRPDFTERFSGLQGEKGEPGAILTGDIPLERLRGRKVIMSPDPEGTSIPRLFLAQAVFL